MEVSGAYVEPIIYGTGTYINKQVRNLFLYPSYYYSSTSSHVPAFLATHDQILQHLLPATRFVIGTSDFL